MVQKLQMPNFPPDICSMVTTYLKVLNDRGCEESTFQTRTRTIANIYWVQCATLL